MREFSFDRWLVLGLQSSTLHFAAFLKSLLFSFAPSFLLSQLDDLLSKGFLFAIGFSLTIYIHSAAWDTLELRGLPVHGYHLFVPIRYHKKIEKAIWKAVQIKQNELVKNTEMHTLCTNTC